MKTAGGRPEGGTGRKVCSARMRREVGEAEEAMWRRILRAYSSAMRKGGEGVGKASVGRMERKREKVEMVTPVVAVSGEGQEC